MIEHPGKINFCNSVKMKTQKRVILPEHGRPAEPARLGTFVKLGYESNSETIFVISVVEPLAG